MLYEKMEVRGKMNGLNSLRNKKCFDREQRAAKVRLKNNWMKNKG